MPILRDSNGELVAHTDPRFYGNTPWWKSAENFLKRKLGEDTQDPDMAVAFSRKRKRPGTSLPRRRFRRRGGFGRSIRRIGLNRKDLKRARYVKNFKRVNFVGPKFMGLRQLQNAMQSKCHFFTSGVQLLTNGAATGNTFIMQPMARMVNYVFPGAGTESSPETTFENNPMYLSGIKLDYKLVAHAVQDYYCRLLCFKLNDGTRNGTLALGASGANGTAPLGWTAITQAVQAPANVGTNIDNAADWAQDIDFPYGEGGAGSAPSDVYAANIGRPNPEFPGTLLLDKKFKLKASQGATTVDSGPTYDLSVFVPCHQMWHWRTGSASQNFLSFYPNYGKHGDFVFFLHYANAAAIAGGAQTGLTVVGETRVYFKDP